MTTETIRTTCTGAYSVYNASLYIRATLDSGKLPSLNTRHLFYWIREGLAAEYLTGIKSAQRLITFKDLISLRIIAAMRAKGIKQREIRIAETELKNRFGWQYPFTMAQFWASPPDIFMRLEGVPMSVSRYWQSAMEFIMEYVVPIHGLTFDVTDSAKTWTPHGGVLINPAVQFGNPCIMGTRVPTEAIWSFHRSGDDLDTLAFMYRLKKEQLENAIGWERRVQEAAA